MPFVRKTKEEFVLRANAVHNNFYNYDKSNYQWDRVKITISCPLHGDFNMTPNNHVAGQNCSKCAAERLSAKKRIKYTKVFKDAMLSVHGEKYDFSKSIYLGDQVKVEVVCHDHGSFWATPSNLKKKKGCPDCQKCGFQPSKSGLFYIFKYKNITKVGITNTSINQRLQRINKSSGFTFKTHSYIFCEDGYKVRELESFILKWLRENYSGVDFKFQGYTECFVDVDIDELLAFISPLK